MPTPLDQAAERVAAEMRWARREGAGFRVVCERLGVDAEEVDAAVVKAAASLPADASQEAAVMAGLLVGVASQGEPS